MTSKIIQIQAVQLHEYVVNLYALCEDGSLWFRRGVHANDLWVRIVT